MACVRVGGTGLGLSAKGGAEGLPSRMKILNWGENPNSRGMRVHVGEKFLAALRAPLYPWRKVALDFEHNTMPGSAAYRESKEPRDVAGFCAVECVPGDGVYIVMEEWTDAGRAKAQMYADLSAAPALDAAGEVVGIQSVALCKCGAVEGMDFVEARVALSAEAARFFDNSNTKDSKMDWKKIIASLLGLNAEAATDEDIKGAAQRVLGLNADSATAEDVRGALRRLLGVDGATNVDGVGGNVAGLSAQIEAALRPLRDPAKQSFPVFAVRLRLHIFAIFAIASDGRFGVTWSRLWKGLHPGRGQRTS